MTVGMRRLLHALLPVAVIAASCAPPPAPVTAVAVPQPAAAACSGAPEDDEPLIVDWRADKRADLEAQLAKGPVVVVHYDCGGLRVLPDCTVDGTYAFLGITEKEQTLQFATPDEVRVNLPIGGAALASRLTPTLRRGGELEVAMALVGKRVSSRASVSRADLHGACDGATHFVRSATLGAFAMAASPAASTGVGSVFERKDAMGRDGSVAACRASAGDTPPTACAAPLRLDLRVIGTGKAAASSREEGGRGRCPKGMVLLDGGACASSGRRAPHVCYIDDPADCDAQCNAGSMSSCALLGRSYMMGRGVPRDFARAKRLLTKACDGGSAPGCGRLGEIALSEHDAPTASRLLVKACRAGWATACASLGHLRVMANALPAPELFQRACLGGDAEGCASLGQLQEKGLGVPANPTMAVHDYQLACDGASGMGCANLAAMVDEGRGTPADPARAIAILRAACDKNLSPACTALSVRYFQGHGVPKDVAKGAMLLQKACEGTERMQCFVLAMRYQAGTGVPKDADKATRYFTMACDAGLEFACKQVQKGH